MRRLLLALALIGATTPALAIFGGRPLGDADPLAHAIAAILYRDDSGAHLCTATVLGPRLVLTAAHCTGDAGSMQVIFAQTLVGVGPDRIRQVAKVARAGKTDAAKGTYAYNNPDDVALVLLQDDAPEGTTFANISATTPAATTLNIAGYGATSDLKGSKPAGFGQALRGASVAVKAIDDALIVIDQTDEAGACTGDSGGPALAGNIVAGVLIGVANKRGATDFCRGTAYYANLARWHDWIVSTARSFD